jgi:hypothetical protein
MGHFEYINSKVWVEHSIISKDVQFYGHSWSLVEIGEFHDYCYIALGLVMMQFEYPAIITPKQAWHSDLQNIFLVHVVYLVNILATKSEAASGTDTPVLACSGAFFNSYNHKFLGYVPRTKKFNLNNMILYL